MSVDAAQRPNLLLWSGGAAAGLLGVARLPHLPSALAGLALGCGLTALAAARTPAKTALVLVLATGALLRAPLLTTWPQSSDDIYRYVWEGRVLRSGESPYLFPPDSPRLRTLRDADVHPRINHPEIPTIYPPLAQSMFALSAFGPAPCAWKTLVGLLELLAAAALGRHLVGRGRSVAPVALYVANPLLILESADGGHVDGAGAALLLLAIVLRESRAASRARWAVVMATLAALVKFTPLVALPLFVRSRRDALPATIAAVIFVGALATTAWTPRGRIEAESLAVVSDPTGAKHAWKPLDEGRIEVAGLGSGWASADGQHALVLIDAQRAILLRASDAPPPTFPDFADARRLLGRFRVAALETGDDDLPLGELTFDAQETLTGAERAWRFNEAGGVFTVSDESGRPIASLRLSDDRQIVTFASLAEKRPRARAIGLAVANPPWLGLSQFSTRWSGRAPAFPHLVRWLGSRRSALAFSAGILTVMLAVAWWRRSDVASATFLLCGVAVLGLPVVYPWYFTWALAAGTSGRWAWVAATLLALTPLLHLV